MSKKVLLLPLAALVVLIGVFCRTANPDHGVPSAVKEEPLPPGTRPTAEVMRERVTAMIESATLPPTQDVLWGKPSSIEPMAAFQRWANDYSAKAADAKIPQGVTLAKVRRVEMARLIQEHPDQALESAIPESVRAAMPGEVRALLEQRVDVRGSLRVLAAYDPESPKAKNAITRTVVTSDGREFDAFTLGFRENLGSKDDLAINGVALDGKLALSQWPGRVLEPVELKAAKLALGAEALCPVSSLSTSSQGTETALKIGERTDFFCGPQHAAQDLTEASIKEVLASGGEGIATAGYLSQADLNWTTGDKKILAVRAKFKDDTSYNDLNFDQTKALVDRISSVYDTWSYGKLKVRAIGSSGSQVTSVTLDKAAADYTSMSVFWADVDKKLSTYKSKDFDFVTVYVGDAPFTESDGTSDTVTWGGMGQVHGKWSVIRANSADWNDTQRFNFNLKTSLHEIGHNLGLSHASNLYTDEPNGEPGAEYGDVYDIMGSGWADYNARYKQWLGWLPAASLPTLYLNGTPGTFTLRPMDADQSTGMRGLQIDLGFGQTWLDWKTVFIEYRLRGPAPQAGVPYLPWDDTLRAYGVQVRMGSPYGPKTWIMDATPETPNWSSGEGNVDSPLMIGRTISFTVEANHPRTVYVTNVGVSPDSGEATIEVQFGPIPDNDPPTGKIQASTSIGATGKTVRFTADVADVEDSDLAYHWRIPGFAVDPTHPAVFPNARSIDVVFPRTAFWWVECTVSDKHGGEWTEHIEFRTVQDGPPTIAGLANLTIAEDGSATVPFTVDDFLTPAYQLVTSVTSSNQQLIPNSSLTIAGTFANRTLTIVPTPNFHGTSDVTVSCSDGEFVGTQTFTVTVKPSSPGVVVLSSGSAGWKYWGQQASPGDKWMQDTFDDAAWPSGTARFTYPSTPLTPVGWTVLPEQSGRITTYFRRVFTMPEQVTYPACMLRLTCDDGAVVYLNGVEIHRQNLPKGAITQSTHALIAIDGPAEDRITIVPLSPSMFRGGDNVIAVEVHDVGVIGGHGDVEFDLELAAVTPPVVGKIEDLVINEDSTSPLITFDASDVESPAGPLTFTAVSSDQSLVLDSRIVFQPTGGPGKAGFTITPQLDAVGVTMITVKVSDGYSETWKTFQLTVLPLNDAPSILPVPTSVALLGQPPAVIEVQLVDIDSDVATLKLMAASDNETVLPNAGIEILPGSAPATRRLRLLPSTTTAGKSKITLTVDDGELSGTQTFVLRTVAALDPTSSEVTLLPKRSEWLYTTQLDLNENGQPVDFTDPAYEPVNWTAGRGKLGFNVAALVTSVSNKPLRVTTYFRKTIIVPNPAAVSQLTLKLQRDDGAALYINGTRVVLSNLPPVINKDTLALTTIPIGDDAIWHTFTVGPEVLVPGVNTIAAEVHQSAMPVAFDSSDLCFDLELTAAAVAPTASGIVIPPGDLWSYYDKPGNPGSEWHSPNFIPATTWSEGLAPLGYDTGEETTVINKLSNNPGFINNSAFFRKEFDVADPTQFESLHLFLCRDDAALVHINGQLALADNIEPNAPYNYLAWHGNVAGEFKEWKHYLIPPSLLVAGRNVITVSVHQHITGGALFFDLQLIAGFKAAPKLDLRPSGGGALELRWSAAYTGWVVQHSADLKTWTTVTTPAFVEGQEACLSLAMQGARGFYRLVRP